MSYSAILLNVDDPGVCVCVCACVRACMYVCLSIASHISETSEARAITFDTLTASVTRMHHVLIILTLTFIQGQPDLNHENNKCLIISETIQAMPIRTIFKLLHSNLA